MGWSCTSLDERRSAETIEPCTVGQRSHALESSVRAGRIHPATFMALVPRGENLGRAGACITPQGRLLVDVSAHLGLRTPTDHRAFTGYMFAPPARHVCGRVAVLAAASAGNYYHWLFDALPRLRIIERAGIPLDSIDAFIVPQSPLRAMNETLSSLGIGADRLVQTRHMSRVWADELLIPSLPGYSGNPTGESIQALRRWFTEVPRSQPAGPKRILVERVGRRVVTNGAELRQVARQHGFECVNMDGMPFMHQVSLFADAEAVIGVHGAALSNLAFCAPATRVLELLSPAYANGCFAALCAEAGHQYHYLLGKGVVADHPHARWKDIEIDPALVGAAIRRLLETSDSRSDRP